MAQIPILSDVLESVRRMLWPPPSRSQDPNQPVPKPRRTLVCGAPSPPRTPISLRTSILPDEVLIFGWPSRGGVIVLRRVNAVHCDFLGISRLDPPLKRAPFPESEDEFCQQLLKLGATWFDTWNRWGLKSGLEEDDPMMLHDVEYFKVTELTLAERLWVEVAWTSDSVGLWVGEWDTNVPGIIMEEQMVPCEVGQLALAASMAERCEVLKKLGAKFYNSLDEYNGAADLKAWEWKWKGEVEPLEMTWPKT